VLDAARRPAGLAALRVLSISHRTASIEELERIALAPADATRVGAQLRHRGIEAVALSTCNRTELYWRSAASTDDAIAEAALRGGRSLAEERFLRLDGDRVVRHLFRVAVGLESQLVGESEVLGQVRHAAEHAVAAGASGPLLDRLFRAAVQFGRRARAETGIGTGVLSAASAAVCLLQRAHGDLAGRTVLVLGAGGVGARAAKHLVAARVRRCVLLNRTESRAEAAAAELGAIAAPLADLGHWLNEADGLIAAVQVGSPLVSAPMLADRSGRRGGRLVIVDASLPRAVDPAVGDMPGVELHDLSKLQVLIAENRARREARIPQVEIRLDRAIEEFRLREFHHAVNPLVAELRLRAEAVRRAEVRRARQRGEGDPEALDRVTRRLVDRLLSVPSAALQAGHIPVDAQHAGYLRHLFGLSGKSGDGAA